MSSTIQGYVRRAHDKRIYASARVKITFLGGEARFPSSQTAQHVQIAATDHDGWFVFRDLNGGSYLVATDGASAQEISVDDYTNITLELLVSPDALTPLPEPTPEPMHDLPRETQASIKGRVISASTGYALENASVMLLSGPGSAPDIAPLTGANGEFSFHGLASGPWTLRAIAPDGASKQLRVEVRSNDTAIVTIAISSDGNDCQCARQ